MQKNMTDLGYDFCMSYGEGRIVVVVFFFFEVIIKRVEEIEEFEIRRSRSS